MAFRRPRVNVKPNVQTSRPVPNTVRSQEIPILTQEEPATQQIEITAQPLANNTGECERFLDIDFNISFQFQIRYQISSQFQLKNHQQSPLFLHHHHLLR